MGTATAASHSGRPVTHTVATEDYATVNPYTGETVREFETLSREELDRAVASAHEAFEPWRRRPISERAANVCRAGELMAERRDRLAELVTLEMGKLICSVPADAPIGDFAG